MIPAPSPDQIALIAALGVVVGSLPKPLLALVGSSGAIVIGAAAADYGIGSPWWIGSGAALILGIVVYAGVSLGVVGGSVAVVIGGIIAGLAVASAPRVTVVLFIVGLLLTAVLSRWATRRGGPWACQTARLIGGLSAFAGAALLFIGPSA